MAKRTLHQPLVCSEGGVTSALELGIVVGVAVVGVVVLGEVVPGTAVLATGTGPSKEQADSNKLSNRKEPYFIMILQTKQQMFSRNDTLAQQVQNNSFHGA